MAPRKTVRTQRQQSRRRSTSHELRKPVLSRRTTSIILGSFCIAFALFWAAFLVYQRGPTTFSFTLQNSQVTPTSTSAALAAEGLTLSSPAQDQQPGIGREQALLLAAQDAPEAAGRAGSTDAIFTLLTYNTNHTQSNYPTFVQKPAWLVHYTKVSEPTPQTSADPGASNSKHDLYVFLDASNGNELLEIWL